MNARPPKPRARANTAKVKGGGAVVQGKGAQAAGKRAVIARDVSGDIHTGDHHGNNFYLAIMEQAIRPRADAQVLRRAYLAWISLRANDLPLLASDSGKPVQLASVYTALLTQGRDLHEALAQAVDPPRRATSARGAPRQSALEALDQERLLVLLGGPGSGKTTFLNFVALCLAGELLGDQTTKLKLLRTPIPAEPDERSETKPKPQRWAHGALLPVRVVLRDLAADLPAADAKISADTLWTFIVKQLPETLRPYAETLKAELLSEKGGLILLDGLDEVPDAKSRREQVKQAVQEFAGVFCHCRFLVTSRTYAYQRQDWKLSGFAERELLPFTPGQIQRFIDSWYAHLAKLCRLSEAEAQTRAETLKRATQRQALRELAQRPLLLTLMARLQGQGGGALPENREEIYAQSVDMLLDQWEGLKPRPHDADGRPTDPEPSLSEWLNVNREDIRRELEKLAYSAHLKQPELMGTADIRQRDLIEALLSAAKDLPDVRVKRLEEYLRDRAGLLASHAEELYQFPHRSFQEYLAACHLARFKFPDQLSELAQADPNRWREVMLLAALRSKQTPSAIWELVEALCTEDAPTDDAPEPDSQAQWGALLAGQVLHETGLAADDPDLVARHQRKRVRVRDWQLRLLRSTLLPARERALAGDLLAHLGDSRQHLLDVDQMRFVAVPRGPFWMGEPGDNRAELHCNNGLNYDYWIAQAPVTVAQCRQFVQASQYDQYDADALRAPGNRPVVWVSWHDAQAFCRWLSQRWRDRLPPGWRVELPSEAEWEKAARGGEKLPTKPQITSLSQGFSFAQTALCANPLPQRTYPWDNEFESDSANCELNVGDVSTPGCFERGHSPYAAEDLVGNVWEWTRSTIAAYPYDASDGREEGNDAKDQGLVLRGGSWAYHRDLARCASRLSLHPGLRLVDMGFRVVLRSSPGV